MKKQYKLLNLHCAGCADALEYKISQVNGVKISKVNFFTKILTIQVENENHEETINNVLTTIKKFDRNIQISDPSTEAGENERRYKIIKISLIIASLVLGVTAFILEKMSLPIFCYLPVYLVAYLLVGYEILWFSFSNIIRGKVFDENFLMSVATIGALCIAKFSEAVMVMLLYQVGELLQSMAVNKSKNAIASLLNIKAATATMLTEDGEKVVDVGLVPINSVICVKPGERIPLDGIVTSGESFLDNSLLTGESKPVDVCCGSEVCSGAVNGDGILFIKVTKKDNESTVSRIIDMVETASTKKAKTEAFISKFARIYTPVVCFVALLVFLIPSLVFGFSHFEEYLYRGLIFLVVSCPCALVISIPLGYFAGIGCSARHGILIKGSNYLDGLNKTQAVIFDKTGTLTQGDFVVDKIFTYGDQNEEEALEFVAYAENYSNHKIAKSIVKFYTEQHQINGEFVTDVTEFAGLGISATIFMIPCLVGNRKLLEKNNIAIVDEIDNETAVYLAINGKHSATITLKDAIKIDSFDAIKALNSIGIDNTYMFTGDNYKIAESVAHDLGIQQFYAELLPKDKVDKLNKLKQSYKNIVFVGDGINDAPVLSSVDVGISMGSFGSDVAVKASDVVILTDEPSKVAKSIEIARKTHRIVTENVVFAITIKLLVLLLSAFGFGFMFLAVFSDVGVAILAVLNSLRALKPPRIQNSKNKTKKIEIQAKAEA